MSIVPLPVLLDAARTGGYAVGYFEAWDGYSLEAIVEAAESERAPVVVGFGCLLLEPSWLDGGGIEQLGALGRVVAERARVPVAFLLNEAHTLEQALRGLDAGFNAVMMTSEGREADAVVADLAELVRVAHGRMAAVEGELGSLPDGGSGSIDPTAAEKTDPRAAARFVAATGVDCLAVSFGNVHLLEGRPAPIDLDALAAIHAAVGVPLVAHGGTGFPPDLVAPAIARGIAKFNVGTVIKRAFLDGLSDVVAALPADASAAAVHEAIGSHRQMDVLVQARARIVPVVRELIRRYGGAGRGT